MFDARHSLWPPWMWDERSFMCARRHGITRRDKIMQCVEKVKLKK